MQKTVLELLAKLAPGATACPGEVARKLGTTQRELRPVLSELAAAGSIAVSQRGAPADLRTLRGPYRIARQAS
jgi:predicted ArsR family transcriptional regulator